MPELRLLTLQLVISGFEWLVETVEQATEGLTPVRD